MSNTETNAMLEPRSLGRESKPFRLATGVEYQGKTVEDCVVRLLNRRDRKNLAEEPEAVRDELALARSVVRLGPVTDQVDIVLLLDHLTDLDEMLIKREIANLGTAHLEAALAEPKVRKIVALTDIISKPFALHPGLVIDGKRQASCIVRLPTRGEWKKIFAETDDLKRDDLALYYSVVQFGDCVNVQPEHIDALTDVDIDRINTEIARLREQFVPDTKSEATEG